MTADGTRTVGDVMTRDVAHVAPGADFKTLVRAMEGGRYGALPVVAADGRVIGMISEADLLPKEGLRLDEVTADAPADDRTLGRAEALTAEGLMTSPATTVHASAPLPQAARTMARLHRRRLPVVDADGRLTGIVSRGDVLRVFLRSDGEIAADVREHAVAPLVPDRAGIGVEVTEGRVRLAGPVPDVALIPLLVRLARSVEGVVDVESALTGRLPRRPAHPEDAEG